MGFHRKENGFRKLPSGGTQLLDRVTLSPGSQNWAADGSFRAEQVNTSAGNAEGNEILPYSSSSSAQDWAASNMLLPSLNPTMRELQYVIRNIAQADLPVLLIGERGTGKEVIARQIHKHHARGDGRFIKVACPEQTPAYFTTLFSEVAQADTEDPTRSTTVFLDEIGDMSIPCQAVVMEEIADGNGTAKSPRPYPRMISANSQGLEEEIGKRRFRKDLYYRLNGICLQVPPLRHRKEDIPALMEFFLKAHGEALGVSPTALQPKTIEVLMQHSWPGNVRELEEIAKNILIFDERTALAALNSLSDTSVAETLGATPSLKEAARNASRQVERELILKMLARTHWNRKRAARELGISYKALLYKLKQIAFDDPRGI